MTANHDDAPGAVGGGRRPPPGLVPDTPGDSPRGVAAAPQALRAVQRTCLPHEAPPRVFWGAIEGHCTATAPCRRVRRPRPPPRPDARAALPRVPFTVRGTLLLASSRRRFFFVCAI